MLLSDDKQCFAGNHSVSCFWGLRGQSDQKSLSSKQGVGVRDCSLARENIGGQRTVCLSYVNNSITALHNIRLVHASQSSTVDDCFLGGLAQGHCSCLQDAPWGVLPGCLCNLLTGFSILRTGSLRFRCCGQCQQGQQQELVRTKNCKSEALQPAGLQ